MVRYRAIVKAELTGKFSQRSLWQIAEIYKRRYEWDKVVENYNAIITITPSGYYADRARSAKADIQEYRRLIDEKRRRIHNNGTLYAQGHAPEHYRTTAQALYDVAESYEQLLDNNSESTWCAEGIYQQAVCYRGIREFAKAYEGFKARMNLGRDVEYYQQAEQIIRELETDKGGNGYEFDIEQEAGTSDQDLDDHRV